MRDVDHRGARPLVEGREFGMHRRAQMRIQVRQRLVEQDERRLHGEAAGERDALALPARERGRPAVGEA